MRVYTSYFAKVKGHVNVASVANSCPSNFPGYHINALVPKWDWVAAYRQSGDFETLAKLYTEQLDNLGIDKALKLINDNQILCCWEANDKPCHRHVLAQWLRDNGVDCEELTEV